MTNNKLKIITILSIFVFILTGYFYFSLLSDKKSAKNQIISNNNDKEDKKIINVESEDKNKDNKEKREISSKKLSILNIVLLLIIFIIIIGVIVAIVYVINKNKFKFNEESKKDFIKENFCPTFFMINPSRLVNKEIDDIKENADSFFEILAKLLFSYNDEERNFLLCDDVTYENRFHNYNYKHTEFCLNDVLTKISLFTCCPKYIDNIDRFIEPIKNENIHIEEHKTKMKEIEEKYNDLFDSYLCAYLIYYLFETIKSKKKVKISYLESYSLKLCSKKTDYINKVVGNETKLLQITYSIKYDIIDKILKKLLSDQPLENVTYL